MFSLRYWSITITQQQLCSSALSFVILWISRATTVMHTASPAARSLLSVLSPLVASLKVARKRATASFSPHLLLLPSVLNIPDIPSACQQGYGSISSLGNGLHSSLEHCLHGRLDAMVTAVRNEEERSSGTACPSSCRWWRWRWRWCSCALSTVSYLRNAASSMEGRNTKDDGHLYAHLRAESPLADVRAHSEYASQPCSLVGHPAELFSPLFPLPLFICPPVHLQPPRSIALKRASLSLLTALIWGRETAHSGGCTPHDDAPLEALATLNYPWN